MEKEILKKLKEIRISRGYTTEDISQFLHIEKSSYEKIESGTNKSWHKYFFELLAKYEYSPEQFFNEISGKNFIHQDNKQENKDNAVGTISGVVEHQSYSDKPMVKSLLAEKDTVISMLKERDADKDKIIQSQEHRIQDLLKIIEKMLGHPPRPKDLVVGK